MIHVWRVCQLILALIGAGVIVSAMYLLIN